MPISKTIAWWLFWAVKFFKKVFPSLSYGRSKSGDKSWYFCYVFRPLCHFSGFHCFHFHYVFFLAISFQTPPQKKEIVILLLQTPHPIRHVTIWEGEKIVIWSWPLHQSITTAIKLDNRPNRYTGSFIFNVHLILPQKDTCCAAL